MTLLNDKLDANTAPADAFKTTIVTRKNGENVDKKVYFTHLSVLADSHRDVIGFKLHASNCASTKFHADRYILARDVVKKTLGEADAIPRMTNCFSAAVINYRTCRNIAVRFNCDGRKVTVPLDGARAHVSSLFSTSLREV